jgi:hypothetical protein
MEAIDEAGDWRLRKRDRSLRRMRCGMSSLKDRHGMTGILLNCVCCRSFQAGIDIDGFIMVKGGRARPDPAFP